MTECSTVKNLGAVFDAHVKAEFVDKTLPPQGDNGGRALLSSCFHPDGRHRKIRGGEFLSRSFRWPLA
jgi:hypothetical protein